MEVYLLLGANLGERTATLQKAKELITERIGPIIRQSSLYETAPWGVTNQPNYINQVVVTETMLSPERLLDYSQMIEHLLGRIRQEQWEPRPIDIDLLYYGPYVYLSERLTVPHKYLHERRFTLVPLCELAPNFVHPVLHKTNQSLLQQCEDASEVILLNQSKQSLRPDDGATD